MIEQKINFDNQHLLNLFNFYRRQGFYISDRFYDYEYLSTSTYNDFVPMINFYVNKPTNLDNVIIYPKIKGTYHMHKGILKDFTEELTSLGRGDYVKLEFKNEGIYKILYVGYGFILDEDFNFLFLASFRGCLIKKFAEFYEEQERSNSFDIFPIEKRDIKIFITYDFMTTYRRFYNRVKREFLDEYLKSGCELSIVDSDIIENSVYGSEFEENSNLKTIEDKISFIEEFRNTILEYEQ